MEASILHCLLHPLQDVDGHGGLLKGDVAAAIFSERQGASLDLPGTCLMPELGDQLMDHTEPGGASPERREQSVSPRNHGYHRVLTMV